MIIKLVIRKEKLKEEKSSLRDHSGEFMLWDNCDMVRFASNGTNLPVTKAEFVDVKLKYKSMLSSINKSTQHFDYKRKLENTWVILKDPEVCKEDERYHYNIIEWQDRISKQWYRLVYDTFVFICDDKGSTIEKVPG